LWEASLDRSTAVRKHLACSLGALLLCGFCHGPLVNPSLATRVNEDVILSFDADLLALLLSLLADETRDTSVEAICQINSVAHHWQIAAQGLIPARDDEFSLMCLPSGTFDDFARNAACLISHPGLKLLTFQFEPILNILRAKALNSRHPPMRVCSLHALAALTIVCRSAVNSMPTQISNLVVEYSKFSCEEDVSVQRGTHAAVRALCAVLEIIELEIEIVSWTFSHLFLRELPP